MKKGLLFHTFKGINGWSFCDHSAVDVARILSWKYFERVFRILDREYKFSLEIMYKENKTSLEPAPITGGKGVAWYYKTVTEQVITKRYRTEYEVHQEIREIEEKQAKLIRQDNKYRSKLLKEMLEDEDE
jgi:hypothetical protein